jgi:hypothetical protein
LDQYYSLHQPYIKHPVLLRGKCRAWRTSLSAWAGWWHMARSFATLPGALEAPQPMSPWTLPRGCRIRHVGCKDWVDMACRL